MDLDLELSRATEAPPIYRQIAEGIRRQILSGDLTPGQRLPPERELAVHLNVNRSTVVSAYDELAAEGLVEGRVGSGTVVSRAGDDSARQGIAWNMLFAQAKGELSPWIRDILASGYRSDLITLAASEPAPELYPLAEVEGAAKFVLSQLGGDTLRYSPTEGTPRLREVIARRLTSRGANVDPENVIVTAGAEQGIDLLAQCFISAGDDVAIETPTYVGAIQAFQRRRARLVGIPVDEEGMRVDILERAIARRPIKLVFTIPSFSNPSGAVTSYERRNRLLEITSRHQIPLIEDNVYGDIYFETPPPPPLLVENSYDHVIHVDGVSKVLFAGLRVGWVVGPTPVIDQLALIKQYSDGFTGTFSQELVCRLTDNGILDRQAALVRASNKKRRDLLLEALRRHAGDRLSPNLPSGGAYLWCELSDGMKSRELLPYAS